MNELINEPKNELINEAINELIIEPINERINELIIEIEKLLFDGGDYCHFLRASISRNKPYRFNNVSSFGMIGTGIPYAIGAQLALPKNNVVVVTGDGSFGFNGMEIDTMVRHNLPVKIILGNNSIMFV